MHARLLLHITETLLRNGTKGATVMMMIAIIMIIIEIHKVEFNNNSN